MSIQDLPPRTEAKLFPRINSQDINNSLDFIFSQLVAINYILFYSLFFIL